MAEDKKPVKQPDESSGSGTGLVALLLIGGGIYAFTRKGEDEKPVPTDPEAKVSGIVATFF